MKTSSMILLTALILLFSGFNTVTAQEHSSEENDVIALSEPFIVTDRYEIYGGEIGEVSSVTPLSTVDRLDFSEKGDLDLHFEGTLTEVCQTRGCNFYLDDGEDQIRVRFVDYSFFIPTNSGGKKSVVRGDFVQKENQETGEHFVEILASAIKIYR
jgi:hypothetical protein